MGRSNRAYKSAKRSKELKRLKKREEKLKRKQERANQDVPEEFAAEETDVENTVEEQ